MGRRGFLSFLGLGALGQFPTPKPSGLDYPAIRARLGEIEAAPFYQKTVVPMGDRSSVYWLVNTLYAVMEESEQRQATLDEHSPP